MKDEEKACHRAAFLHFLQSMVSAGSDVEANLADGTVYKASFYTSTPFKGEEFKIALKNAKPVGKSNADGKTIVVPGKSFASIKVSSLDLAPRGAGGRELQTDSSIRGRDVSHLEGRELQTASAWLDPSTMTELEGSSNGKSNEPFNQFDVNKRLFGVQSTYSEDIYTKSLDTSKMTKAQLEKAERLAREIESQQSSNIHMQEERGHALEREID
jgi:PAB1-binding protein PBP1